MRRLDSVHLQRWRGQKRHPFLLLGRRGGGGLTPINSPSPSHFLPGVLGLCQECPRSHCPPGALFLVTHHQAFSAVHSAPPPLHPQYTPTHTHTRTNTPPGQCVLWSLTLNRPPRLNTTDRQASGHQVQRPESRTVAQQGKRSQLFSPVWFSYAFFVLQEKETETMARVFPETHNP